MKLAIIGGAGVRVPLLVNGLVQSRLPITDIALYDTDRERLEAIAADPECLALVAEVDGAVAGFLTVEPAGPGRVELTRLYVDPERRRGGVGRLLLDAAIDVARRAGARSILVNVFADNAVGRGFYEREGFRLLRLEPTRVGDQEVGDAWYERALDAG